MKRRKGRVNMRNMRKRMYRICWRSLITGISGHGKAVFTREEAGKIIKASDKRGLKYWCEAVPSGGSHDSEKGKEYS